MNYYALLYELVDDMVTRRVPFREEHLRLAREARERGELVLAGALAEPVDRALLVFHVDDKSKVEAFARKDPYVVNGLAKKWEVRPWNVVVGNDRPASPAATLPGAITRHWSARTTEAQLPRYLDHFSINVVPELRRVAGYLGATISLRKAKSKSSSKPPGVPSKPFAPSPAPTSKPPSSPTKPPPCLPTSIAASAITKLR